VGGKVEFHVLDEDNNEILFSKAGAVQAFPSGTEMWFNQNTAPTGWTINSTPADSLLAVKGGTDDYNVAGGTEAGIWTVGGLTKDAHGHGFTQPSNHDNHSNHVFTQPSAHGITQPTFTGPSHAHPIPGLGYNAAGNTLEVDESELSTSGTITASDNKFASTSSSGAQSRLATNAGGTGACTRTQNVALSNNHSGGAVDAHSAHSAHAGGAVGAQTDAGITSAGDWRPLAQVGIICTKD